MRFKAFFIAVCLTASGVVILPSLLLAGEKKPETLGVKKPEGVSPQQASRETGGEVKKEGASQTRRRKPGSQGHLCAH